MRYLALLGAVILCTAAPHAQKLSDLDKALADFWKAEDAKAAERASERLIKSGADFETLHTRLAAGRRYAKEKTGQFGMRFPAGAGLLFDNMVEVPADYSPDRRWTLRVQLHGGVNRPGVRSSGASLEEEDAAAADGGGAPRLDRRRQQNRIPGESQIYIFPSGFAEAEWWHAHQVDNILRLVDRITRRYNVDETQIYLTGISDGGTGIYYMAMKDPTVWSAFLPLNGSIKVLSNPSVRADGEMYAGNLVNRPFYIVSGGRDPLYPAEHVATHVQAFTRLGVPLVFRPQPNAGHDTSWWPYERNLYEQFVKQRARVAHPVRLSWQTERTDRFNRVDWLVIDRLGMGSNDFDFEPLDLFEHRRPSGRVDVARKGNAFTASTRGVRAFTLLLAPDVIDFSQPVTVIVNDKPAFEGRITKDVRTLVKWAARDNDRTRLYGAELQVQVP